ncbi:MAG TPA: histidine phosphatase family protein [Edaphobacter sp.]|nr:histidine phosphatase family protein [Edaphobacter sp.]
MRVFGKVALPAIVLAFGVTAGGAQSLSGAKLVGALQHGGYVIVMRHAHSPIQPPDKSAAESGNTKGERQLDDRGKADAKEMGDALRRLKIPIGEVLSSPTYRAQETARYAKLPEPRAVPELGENGASMQGVTTEQAEWLRRRVKEFPKGTNTLLVTHSPNLKAAFPQEASDLADGEALIFGPDGRGGAALIGRVKIEDWNKL